MTNTADKGDMLKVRMDAATLSMMDTARAYLNLDKSKFIRESVREKAESVIAQHQKTQFSPGDWAAFFGALDAPAAPTRRMTKAAQKFRDIQG
ncbi:DUF1778 domain-containing protein [Aurantimonas sp. VKM B-3413]|uniref:type II toxin-antitoxin system TacA family antitoxin n=1 Tax=Aurantimonas sp. VKM B-3413 TaxID=2779401 RepID=UPI001E2B0726|nr:DUF1778 domain-containing protein [Aurantimonas sp. VKM B-3413]MCB8840032.1 DUF1778 domain-containing protein [Aurantimonas sp. VKM B-3413]